MECFTCKTEMKCFSDVVTESVRLDFDECPRCKSVATITMHPRKNYITKVEWKRDSTKDTPKNAGQISDGYHTFDELYHHRMALFSVICNTYKDKAWKSWKHADGTMYDDYFIVGITTPKGDYTYHYHKDHWDIFNVKEIPNAPAWDGHKPSDIDRLFDLIE